MGDLDGTVVAVTGANRGIGKGIAIGLGEAGATVYVTGRASARAGAPHDASIEGTAAEVDRAGGTGIAVQCDHRDDAQVAELFERIRREQGRLDVLVNNAAAIPEPRFLWGGKKFWETPVSIWDDVIDVGLRSHFVASWFAAPLMIERRAGLIVHVSSHAAAGSGKTPTSPVLMAYSVGKAGLQRLTNDMAVELLASEVSVVSIWPPATRTEAVVSQAEIFGGLDGWSSPLLTGRVLAAFVRAGDHLQRTGQSLAISELAEELDVRDDPS